MLVLQVEQFTNALQRQSVAREEEGEDYEEDGGLPEAVEDLADEMALAALSRTISMREDPPAGLPMCTIMTCRSVHVHNYDLQVCPCAQS